MNRPQGRHINGPDLLAYLDGELSAAETAQVEAHLATCPDCAAELAELRFLRDGLEATIPPALAGVSLSPAAADRVRGRLGRRGRAPPERRTTPAPGLGPVAAESS